MNRHLSIFFALVLLSNVLNAQTGNNIENVIIITTDGFRWQEVFKGMDPSIASDNSFNQKDSMGIYKKYWGATADERRKKLLPFIWNVMASQGQLYGNRDLNSKVNNANPYWFSYPGYNEILCGFVDTAINSNDYPANPNTNLLEFLNKKDEFKGRVAAFGAWDAFGRILNAKRSGFSVVCSHDNYGGTHPDAEQRLINEMKAAAYNPLGEQERLDVFTQYAVMDHLKKQKPRVLYISYGETDEWAHSGHYKDYLEAAHTVDKWLSDICAFIQSDKQYKNKTLLFISVDHGRGNGSKWTSHNSKIPNSNEIWFGVMGPRIAAKGEMSADVQLYQKQYAQTIAQLLGYTFKCEHPVADGFKELLVK
jgi:hypothetical protein